MKVKKCVNFRDLKILYIDIHRLLGTLRYLPINTMLDITNITGSLYYIHLMDSTFVFFFFFTTFYAIVLFLCYPFAV